MLTTETLQDIRRIELHTRHLVNASFAGAYHSVFKGHGIAFDSVRPYQPGDNVRDIDWNVTARTGETYIKQYQEERELTVILLLDSSASSSFGTINKSKRELATEIGAVLALSAVSNNDQVGLLIFSDQIEHYTAPRKGRNHVLRLIRDLLAASASGKGTDLSLALRSVRRLLKQHAIIFLMSDFLASPAEYASDLAVVSSRHDLIALVLSDPLEQSWPNAGLVWVKDAETGAHQLVNTASRRWYTQFQHRAKQFQQTRDITLSQAGVDRIDIPLNGDYTRALARFFRQRSKRRL